MTKLAAYWKFLVSLLTPVFLSIHSAVTDNRVTNDEIVFIVSAFVGSVLVLIGPRNKENNGSEVPSYKHYNQ